MSRKKPPKASPAPPPPEPPRSLAVVETTRFGKDFERQLRRGKGPARFVAVLRALVARRPLPAALRDHALAGQWTGCRDCHIEPDWILIYEITSTELILHRTGTHADLF